MGGLPSFYEYEFGQQLQEQQAAYLGSLQALPPGYVLSTAGGLRNQTLEAARVFGLPELPKVVQFPPIKQPSSNVWACLWRVLAGVGWAGGCVALNLLV